MKAVVMREPLQRYGAWAIKSRIARTLPLERVAEASVAVDAPVLSGRIVPATLALSFQRAVTARMK